MNISSFNTSMPSTVINSIVQKTLPMANDGQELLSVEQMKNNSSGYSDELNKLSSIATLSYTKDTVTVSKETSYIYNEYSVKPTHDAGDALIGIKDQLDKMKNLIGLFKPGLKSNQWDFSLKDGGFVVNGVNLKPSDTKEIEFLLNSNKNLVNFAKQFNASVIKFLETSSENPSMQRQNSYLDGGLYNHTFYDVKNQINGNINFKEMLSKLDGRIKGCQMTFSKYSMGENSLGYIASKIKSSTNCISYSNFAGYAYKDGIFYDKKGAIIYVNDANAATPSAASN